MAKRKRLSMETGPAPRPAPEPAPRRAGLQAPIAQVAGEASASAALEEVAGALQAARVEGRLLLNLPLAEIDAEHLIRDRMVSDDDDMQSLMQSLAQRGQQTPIEVVELEPGRYGLISGWRRLQALARLEASHVLAVVRQPETAADAYMAMIEENEIRVGLSYFERARVAAKAAELGLYATPVQAVQALFANASRAKRSKIKSFLGLYETLGEALRFPTAISERLGLALVAAMDRDAGLAQRMRDRLRKGTCAVPEEEVALLQRLMGEKPPAPAPKAAAAAEVAAGIRLDSRESRRGLTLSLSGPAVTPELRDRLRRWLRET